MIGMRLGYLYFQMNFESLLSAENHDGSLQITCPMGYGGPLVWWS